MQALFNQDNGTGRIASISMSGVTGAGEFFRRWLSRMPEEIARDIRLVEPGRPGGGSDHASFTCHGAPAFNLSSRDASYVTYTWHTNRDTFDKLILDELRHNATLIAMLAYQASEDPERIPRAAGGASADARTGRATPARGCRPPARSWAESAGG